MTSPTSWTPPKARIRQNNNNYQHKPIWSEKTIDMEDSVFPSFQSRGERTSLYGSSSGKPTQATQSAIHPIADLKELEALEDPLKSAREAAAKAPLPTPKEVILFCYTHRGYSIFYGKMSNRSVLIWMNSLLGKSLSKKPSRLLFIITTRDLRITLKSQTG